MSCCKLNDISARKEQLENILKDTDSIMTRAIEDLINLLVDKGIITKEDLHPNIFKNIEIRNGIRLSIRELSEIKESIAQKCLDEGGL